MNPKWERERVNKMTPFEKIEYLERELKAEKDKNFDLEERVERLRVSRRVLMNLLEKVERQKISEVSNLTKALELERKRKHSSLGRNHPAMLARSKPFDIEGFIQERDPNGQYEDVQAMRNPQPYLDDARADIEKENEQGRLRSLAKTIKRH